MKSEAILPLILCLLGASAGAAEWEGVPADYEGPPWGERRFQRLGIRAGLEYALPVWGDSGGDSAAYAPEYADGWDPGLGWAADLHCFLCPEYSVFVSVGQFAFESSGPVIVGAETHEFGPVSGTTVAAGLGLHLPLSIETELWLCTVAPSITGPVLYAQVGVGAALLEDLDLTVTPVPAAGNPPWWEASTFLFGCARLGLEYRAFRFLSVFVEVAAGGFAPEASRPGASDATAFVYAGLRGGITLFLF